MPRLTVRLVNGRPIIEVVEDGVVLTYRNDKNFNIKPKK